MSQNVTFDHSKKLRQIVSDKVTIPPFPCMCRIKFLLFYYARTLEFHNANTGCDIISIDAYTGC
jgi:hypothetical protein